MKIQIITKELGRAAQDTRVENLTRSSSDRKFDPLSGLCEEAASLGFGKFVIAGSVFTRNETGGQESAIPSIGKNLPSCST